ncbi:hypothetical protein [Microaceticoccus formicicus]|uniref:hypothetical protein n=1 Tax=Microaceticoccus formicicus TaxID=3118105 RepID=UPI003CD05064|nr:hypothetical protein VZL98_11855 [Peptoniphilaceae bacterium AMB_02]
MKKNNRIKLLLYWLLYGIVLYVGIYLIPESKYYSSLRGDFRVTIPLLVLYAVVFYGICGFLVGIIIRKFNFRNDKIVLIIMSLVNFVSLIIVSLFTKTSIGTYMIPFLKLFYGMYFLNIVLATIMIHERVKETNKGE